MAAPRFTTPPHVIIRRHATTHHPGTTRRHRVITGLGTAVDAQAMAALVTGGPATAAVEVTGMVAVVATMVIAHRPKGQGPVVAVPALAGMAITVAEEVAVAPHRADLLAEATSVRTATSAEAATVVPAAATDKPTRKRRSQERRFFYRYHLISRTHANRCGGVRKINIPTDPPMDGVLPRPFQSARQSRPMECSRCPASASAACDPCRSNAPAHPRRTPGAGSN